jgi:hypothetical protein
MELRTTESALLELSQELGISESDMGGKVTFEGKYPLPAPAGNFSIWLRTYWPDQAILDGTWKPPVIDMVK